MLHVTSLRWRDARPPSKSEGRNVTRRFRKPSALVRPPKRRQRSQDSLLRSARGQPRGAGEVAVQLLVRATRSVRERLHKEIAADEGTFPRGAKSAEHLLAVTPTPGLVDSDLEGLQLLGQLRPGVGVVGGDAGDQ